MRTRLLAAAALAAAAVTTATPAANAACVGTAQTVRACVNPGALPQVDPEGSSYDDCIYLGVGPCRPVSVPLPGVTPGSGELVTVICGGELAC
ncbi:MAG TPA: hypothetical protein VNA20_11535 [Frankiaceae bacterium]|nr:hypothetical protein [Frankiaceae bacterium]